MSDKRRIQCPFCGLLVLFNDAEQNAAHQVPVCSGFTKLVEQTNGKLTGLTTVNPNEYSDESSN